MAIIPRLTIRRVADRRIVATDNISAQCCPVFSHDGRWIAFQATKPALTLEITNVSTGRTRRLGTSKCFGFQYFTLQSRQ